MPRIGLERWSHHGRASQADGTVKLRTALYVLEACCLEMAECGPGERAEKKEKASRDLQGRTDGILD